MQSSTGEPATLCVRHVGAVGCKVRSGKSVGLSIIRSLDLSAYCKMKLLGNVIAVVAQCSCWGASQGASRPFNARRRRRCSLPPARPPPPPHRPLSS